MFNAFALYTKFQPIYFGRTQLLIVKEYWGGDVGLKRIFWSLLSNLFHRTYAEHVSQLTKILSNTKS